MVGFSVEEDKATPTTVKEKTDGLLREVVADATVLASLDAANMNSHSPRCQPLQNFSGTKLLANATRSAALEASFSANPVSGDCSALRPNQPPPGSMQGIPGSVSSRSGKVGLRSGRPRRLRQDMRWRNDYGASGMFLTHDSHADLNQQALSQCRCVG